MSTSSGFPAEATGRAELGLDCLSVRSPKADCQVRNGGQAETRFFSMCSPSVPAIESPCIVIGSKVYAQDVIAIFDGEKIIGNRCFPNDLATRRGISQTADDGNPCGGASVTTMHFIGIDVYRSINRASIFRKNVRNCFDTKRGRRCFPAAIGRIRIDRIANLFDFSGTNYSTTVREKPYAHCCI
jgi:hypothetical protein